MELVWTAAAEAELIEAFTYIADDNPSAARRVLSDIHEAATKLTLFPLHGRTGRVAGTRELVIPRTPYLLAYRIEATRIVILHLFHGAQRWPEEF